MVWSPLAGGFLSGKLHQDDAVGRDRRIIHSGRRLDAATLPSSPYPHWLTPRVADAGVHVALAIPLATPPIR